MCSIVHSFVISQGRLITAAKLLKLNGLTKSFNFLVPSQPRVDGRAGDTALEPFILQLPPF